MPHIGQPGFGAKDIVAESGFQAGRRGRCCLVSLFCLSRRWFSLYGILFAAGPRSVTCRQSPMSSHPTTTTTTTTTISSAFESFREQLDEHYDRRERIIKVSLHQLYDLWLVPSKYIYLFPVRLTEMYQRLPRKSSFSFNEF